MEEVWKDIEGYEGLYQVSSLGKVRSLNRKVRHSSGNSMRVLVGKEILTFNAGAGYLCVSLCKKGTIVRKYVHHLVSAAFLETQNNKKEINHKNGIKTDNKVENLEWCTHGENQKHSWKTGLRKKLTWGKRGEKNYNSKLTKEQVLEIREKYVPKKYSLRRLAREYGVSNSQITRIIDQTSWRHI